ncbi:MAG TPA: TonB-dependent receptor, partial [Thioalkalivibrio sp.]|nr:TonB-dependent receptor [Thioalkalivibrio sp.]
TTEGTPGTGSGNNRIASAEAWALFVQDTITAGDWTVQPGLRYESIDTRRVDYGAADPDRAGTPTVVEGSEDVLMPGIGITRRVSPNLRVLAGVHRGFTPPAPGSADAEAEDSVNYELGLRYARGALAGEMIGFFNDYDNLLGTCTASSGGDCVIGDQFNGGQVEIKGIEASLHYDLGIARGLGYGVPMRVGYTYTDAEFKTGFISGFDEWGTVEPGDELPYLPQHLLTAGVGIDQSTWRVDLNAVYTGEMRTVAGQGDIPSEQKIDDRVIIDLAADYRISKDGRVFATVENLFDETYLVSRRPAGLRPGKPRSLMAGLKFDF